MNSEQMSLDDVFERLVCGPSSTDVEFALGEKKEPGRPWALPSFDPVPLFQKRTGGPIAAP